MDASISRNESKRIITAYILLFFSQPKVLADSNKMLILWQLILIPEIMRLLKSFIVWICFIPVAILNGGLREYVLVRLVGEETALPVSGILLSIFIFLETWLVLPRLAKGCSLKDCLIMGICWALLTVAFESVVGIAGGSTVTEVLTAYNPFTGNLWVLVLAMMMLSPVLLKVLRRI